MGYNVQTNFSITQLAEPNIGVVNDILRKCVHCGFCTATCPTYILRGDELDGPRGRIYQIKQMLETEAPPSPHLVKHIDRCLSCLSCMTTCPASVNYMHLVDDARTRIEETFTRPLAERMLREILARVLPKPGLLRLSLIGANLIKPFARLLPGRLSGLVAMAPARVPKVSTCDTPQVFPAEGQRLRRVALMTGCAQQVLRPAINEATIRLLTRHGCEVVVAAGAGCCGALVHHMGREAESQAAAIANIRAWQTVAEADGGLDAIVINASGCGTTVKDYGFMLRTYETWAEPAAWVSGLTKDITEVMSDLGLAESRLEKPPVVAYHSACSMQHGQGLTTGPKALLQAAGFEVRSPAESHICCGSAGTYNIMQPELAGQLRERKVSNLRATNANVIATGNIGCLVQIGGGTALPVVHTIELLDWATGGPPPSGLA